MEITVTTELLESMGACHEEVQGFALRHPSGVELNPGTIAFEVGMYGTGGLEWLEEAIIEADDSDDDLPERALAKLEEDRAKVPYPDPVPGTGPGWVFQYQLGWARYRLRARLAFLDWLEAHGDEYTRWLTEGLALTAGTHYRCVSCPQVIPKGEGCPNPAHYVTDDGEGAEIIGA